MDPSHPTADEMRLFARVSRSDDSWASQPRAVYRGEVMDQELRELFPVEVGLEALRKRREQKRGDNGRVG